MFDEEIGDALRTATSAVFVSACFVSACFVSGSTSVARAADASGWVGDERATVRLIAGAASDNGVARTLRAGVEIKLAGGWKTYWRYPGDSGVPPHFEFGRSQNVRSIAVAWPAPHTLADGEGRSIGYEGGVTFPLRITAIDPGKPVIVRLDLDYAVCGKVCVPASSNLELEVTGAPSAHDAALTASEDRVPKIAALGDARPISIRAARLENGTGQQRVTVDLTATAPVELFAEGPTPDWALPIPRQIRDEGALKQFAFDVDGLPPGATINGAMLRLTAVSGAAAVEVTTRID